ncbi:MAG: nitroreductase family protein [Deltaproteobacteria bacterium]|nr:MAG: nitroreductase family protein [Deltaproteobacteria bacterium]
MDLDLDTVDRLLTTTRSVRKRLDLARAVDPAVLERAIEIALQAPTGSNSQGWHFVVVTEARKRARIGELYRKAFEAYVDMPNAFRDALAPEDPRARQLPRIVDSATYLAQHLHEVPVLVIACIEGRVESAPPVVQASHYGSILPAVWSLMLALRARGVGSAWTTLHIMYEREIAELLEIPEHVTQAALLPIAYFKGADFKPASRLPARQFTHWNAWGARR